MRSTIQVWDFERPRIAGYTPALNFQGSLAEAVVRWLDRCPDYLPRIQRNPELLGELAVGPPPTFSNRPRPTGLREMQEIARKFDAAGRDERNRALGRAGEERVLAHEKATLIANGRPDLANCVKWVSQEEGDGAGYDIASFSPQGHMLAAK